MNFTRRKANLPMSQHPFDVNNLEEEIRNTMPTVRQPNQEFGKRHTPMLEQPMVSAEDLGRITAEAIKAAHEAAAKSLDELGKEIADRVNRIEQIKSQSLEQIKECEELAKSYRDAGNLLSAQVESASLDLSEARDMIDNMKKKIKS